MARRAKTRQRAACTLALIGCGLAGGCAELPEIPQGTCGNDIVDKGEDCDTFAPAGRVCRAPGAVGECRYDCAERSDHSRPSCPEGWACGTDAICRVASGRFAPLGEPIPADAVLSADFDGDHRSDLMLADESQILVRFYDADGAVGKSFGIRGERLELASAGDLTGDGLTDLLLPVGAIGVGVLRAQPDRTLVPVVQSSIAIGEPVKGSSVIPIEVLQDKPGIEAVAIFPLGGGMFGVLPVMQGDNPNEPNTQPIFVLAGDAAKIVGDVPVGSLHQNPATPCQDLVFGYAEATEVHVYTPCKSASELAYGAQPHVVKLRSGAIVAGRVFIADVNADARADLVISAYHQTEGWEIEAAYGLGDGSFHSDYENLPATGPGDDTASTLFIALGGGVKGGPDSGGPAQVDDGLPLAVGDLNLDGRADAVAPSILYLSHDAGDGKLQYDVVYTSGSWTSAVIADFNGNGFPDIMGGSRDVGGIDFYNGLGTGVFNPFLISTQGPVDHFAVGDFDGDLILDLTYAERSNAGLDDSLSFLFGKSVGAPEEPVSAGRLHAIQQVVAGDRLLQFVVGGDSAPTVDGMTDLAVLSLSDDEKMVNLTVVPGSSDRRLQSPYLFLHAGAGQAPDQPVRSTIGRLTPGDTIGDLAFFTLQADYITRNLWLIPSDADAKFGQYALTPVPADFAPYAYEYLLVGGELDGHDDPAALDEVLLIAHGDYAETGPAGASIAIFRAKQDGVGLEAPEVHETSLALREHAQIVDVDGDGFADLVALSDDFGVLADDPMGGPPGGEPPPGRRVHVFWNNAGVLDFDAPTTLPDLPLAAGDFAVLNADGNPDKEIVVGAPGGMVLYDLDAGARTFEKVGPLAGVPGGAGAVAADFDGDGVDDLAINDLSEQACSVFLGQPVRR